MSSPTNTHQGGHSTSQPVVQTILESFTRCFNPVAEGHACPKLKSKQARGDITSRSRKSGGPSTSALFGFGSSGNTNNITNPPRMAPRAVSRSISSSDSRQKAAVALALDASYDADRVAHAKKAANRSIMMSAEAMEERSMKRKLEIFRGTSNEGRVTRPTAVKLAPRHQQSSRALRAQPRSSSRGPFPTNSASAVNLALSDDEEELIRLTQSSKRRFACGMQSIVPDRMSNSNSTTISSVAKLFNFGFTEAQKPFGLCFATPVRTSSNENVATMSDDKLTDNEFLLRHCEGNTIATVTPAGGGGQSSYCEEETISSTIYFDQKYSHIMETRPPMPLFQENMLSCSETSARYIIQHHKLTGSPPVELVTKNNGTSIRKMGGGGGKRSSSPDQSSSIFKSHEDGDSYPPSPVRIRDQSLSLSFTDENNMNQQQQGQHREMDAPKITLTSAEI